MPRKTSKRRTKSRRNSFLSRFTDTPLKRGLSFVFIFAVLGISIVAISNAASPNRCTPDVPHVQIQNTFTWASWGTWAKQGQKVPYQIAVYSYDCVTANYTVTVKAPDGFSQDLTTFTASLKPRQIKYFNVNITSPADVPVSDYPVVAASSETHRDGTVTTGNSDTSYYKVYTSDTTPPAFNWQSPGTGNTVSGTVSLSDTTYDEHLARKIELYIDGALVASNTNDGIVGRYTTVGYNWNTKGVAKGVHTLVFKGYDDFGNEADDTWQLTVK